MRQALLALAIAGSIATIAAAQGHNDAARVGLVGPVKVVRAESLHAIRADGGYKPDGRPRPVDTVTYDEVGNYREREMIDDYGFPVGKETFEYVRQRLTRAQLDPKGALLERREFGYGASSQYQTVKFVDRSGSAYQEQYTRGVGERIEAIRYVADAKEVGTTIFTYRSDPQKPDEVAFFVPGGRPATAPVGPCLGAHRLVYRYVEGRVSQRELFEEDGSLKRRPSFKYDSHGNVIEETRTDGPMESLFRCEYQYDDHGNWIRREETISYDTGRKSESSAPLLRITSRTIEYF